MYSRPFMDSKQIYLTIFLISFITAFYILYLRLPKEVLVSQPEAIYCVMITGKNDSRQKFAEIAIANFKMQSYSNKKLVIINESDRLDVGDDDIIERVVNEKERERLTLGDLRNMAFEYIPEEAIWTTWDDDDWRSDNYLQYLYDNLKSNDYVFFTRRIEHNFNTDFTWIMELKTGFVIMFGRKKTFAKYDRKEFNEDIKLKKTISKHLRFKVIENDPIIYIRFTHKDNTSTLVKERKTSLKDTSSNKVYFESAVNGMEKLYVDHIVKTEFS